jgi:hypothetical protein
MFNRRRTGAYRMSPGKKGFKKSQSPATGGLSLALNRATTRKRAKRFLVSTDFASQFSLTSLMWSARKHPQNPPGFSCYSNDMVGIKCAVYAVRRSVRPKGRHEQATIRSMVIRTFKREKAALTIFYALLSCYSTKFSVTVAFFLENS